MSIAPETLFRALADPTRLRLLVLLAGQDELCVCDLTGVLGLSQPKVSRHLAHLREAGVVADRPQGRWVYYRLHPELPHWARTVIASTAEAGRAMPPHREDLARLDRIANRPDAACCG